MRSIVVLGVILSLNPAWAEESESAERAAQRSLTTTVPNARQAGDIIGEVQIRPSFGYNKGQAKAENTVNLGVRLGPDSAIDYTQYFNANLADPGNSSNNRLASQDGFLRARFQNVWNSVRGDLRFDYEARAYLPMDPVKANNGMIVGLRNYFSLTKKLTSKFAITVQEIPVIYGYSRAGNPSPQGGGGIATPLFENRVYVIGNWDISPNLIFSFPLQVWATHTRNYASDARNNGRFTLTAMIWPELNWRVAAKTFLGAAFYSGNFVNKAETGLDFVAGLSAGVGQLILRQVL